MRPRMTKAQWHEHVTNWRASDRTCREYAEQFGLNPQTLAWHAKKLRAETAATTSTDFIELAPVEVTKPEPIDLHIGEFRIRLPSNFEPAVLARLLDVVEARR